jgi:hypothetical protein
MVIFLNKCAIQQQAEQLNVFFSATTEQSNVVHNKKFIG